MPQVPYTIWQLVEHIRIAQWDIVEFSLNPTHESPQWPEGYWPDKSLMVDVSRRWNLMVGGSLVRPSM